MAHSIPSLMYSSWLVVLSHHQCQCQPHLLQDKHVVVEELLKLLVAKVDRQLLEPVEVKDLKASDVENTFYRLVLSFVSFSLELITYKHHQGD